MHLIVASVIGFAASCALYPFYIKWLKAKQVEQYLREDGPESHQHKARTPTMGGLVFSLVILIAAPLIAVLVAGAKPSIVHVGVLAVALVCGLIGFVDDYAKVVSRSNVGISGYMRLGLETALGAGLGAYIVFSGDSTAAIMPRLPEFGEVLIPIFGPAAETFASGVWPMPAVLFILLASFLVASTSNALNLHDGMDGLCAGTACQVFAVMALILFATGQVFLSVVAAVSAGALCGFLMFNRNPAALFMGDTGSLFIGGLLAALVIAGGLVVWFVPLSLIYIAEAVSVMMQVLYFKLTKTYEGQEKDSILKQIKVKLTRRLPGEGKRLFRMAPLHHHYEAVLSEKGWQEWQVVMGFWFVQFLLTLSVLIAFLLTK